MIYTTKIKESKRKSKRFSTPKERYEINYDKQRWYTKVNVTHNIENSLCNTEVVQNYNYNCTRVQNYNLVH